MKKHLTKSKNSSLGSLKRINLNDNHFSGNSSLSTKKGTNFKKIIFKINKNSEGFLLANC